MPAGNNKEYKAKYGDSWGTLGKPTRVARDSMIKHYKGVSRRHSANGDRYLAYSAEKHAEAEAGLANRDLTKSQKYR